MSLEAEKLFYAAMQHLQAGRIGEAADGFLELVQKHPAFAPAHTRLGDIFTESLKDLARAENNYKQAIASDAGSAESHTGYALLLILTERYAEANAHLNKAANIRGAEKDTVQKLFGMLHEAQAHLDEAISAYKKALLATFSDEVFAACEKAIARCEAKKKYL